MRVELWRRYLRWRQRNVVAIELAVAGFRVVAHAGTSAVAWDEIDQVVAFKRDLMAVDLLCIGCRTATGVVELHEQMIGYPAFEAEMERRFMPSPEWKLRVLFPAFETNPTLLFERHARA